MGRNIGRKGMAIAGAALAVGIALSGCAASEPVKESKSTSKTEHTEAPKPEITKTPETKAPSAGEAGAVLAPGDSVTGAGSVPFVNHDGKTAVFSHLITSIEPAAAADYEWMLSKSAELKNYDVYLISVESHFVSGDDLAYSAFYTELKPIDSAGDDVQSIALIGTEFCPSNSIPSPGNDPAAAIVNCIAAVVPKGAEKPAGLQWEQYDTEYASYEGKPAVILFG